MPTYKTQHGNTIVADQSFIDTHYPGAVLIAEAAPVQPLGTRVSNNAFLARFKSSLVSLYELAMTNASVQIYRDKVIMSKNGIDLASQITIADVGSLLASGLITQELHDAILDTTTITEDELP